MVFATWQGPAALGPAVNRMNAGRAIPVSFGLGWDRGSDLLAAGSPASQRVDCGSLAAIGPMESASGPGLVGGSSTGKYTYVWKTDKAWSGTCRRLVLDFSIDGGARAVLYVQFT